MTGPVVYLRQAETPPTEFLLFAARWRGDWPARPCVDCCRRRVASAQGRLARPGGGDPHPPLPGRRAHRRRPDAGAPSPPGP
ncbi:MAG: hypothetical protein ACRD0K_22160, partial [Egibacteraceae bacterium]